MNKTQLRNKLRNLFNNIIIDERTLFAAVIESEVVIGRFVIDEISDEDYIAFRSSICPEFIKVINRDSNEKEGSGLTGFYGIISEINIVNEKVYVSFDEGKTLSLVEPLRVFDRYMYETDGIVAKD